MIRVNPKGRNYGKSQVIRGIAQGKYTATSFRFCAYGVLSEKYLGTRFSRKGKF